MFAALVGTAFWLFNATYFSLPVSTTHSIVGGIMGFAIYEKGFDAINWSSVGGIAISWVISPVSGFLVSWVIFKVVLIFVFDLSSKDSKKRLLTFLPFLYGITAMLFVVFCVESVVKVLDTEIAIGTTLLCAFGVAVLSGIFVRVVVVPNYAYIVDDDERKSVDLGSITDLENPKKDDDLEKDDESRKSFDDKKNENEGNNDPKEINLTLPKAPEQEEIASPNTLFPLTRKERALARKKMTPNTFFKYEMRKLGDASKLVLQLQVVTALFVAFGHGASDVPSAAGPLSGILQVGEDGVLSDTADENLPVTSLCALMLVFGLMIFGRRILLTVGEKITKVSPFGGFVAQLATALTTICGSRFGMPISTTHVLIGAVAGIGHARCGMKGVNVQLLKRIVISWIFTLPIAGFSATMVYAFFLKWNAFKE
eukprot:TRINITY_DN4863_c0_g1_i1.p1 TRINITY_DN4863_c0_g1~~TRINITY_DN4863_c0_g1_i1.p1  ORF type:complete len:426 (-),score=121.60 TRINITY_DN4863_c0_g1_i1:994-2271(-)